MFEHSAERQLLGRDGRADHMVAASRACSVVWPQAPTFRGKRIRFGSRAVDVKSSLVWQPVVGRVEGDQPGYQLARHPHRIAAFEQALAYITGHDDVWVTTGREIADWYYEHNYDQAVAHNNRLKGA